MATVSRPALMVPPCPMRNAFNEPTQSAVPLGRNATPSPSVAALPLTVMTVELASVKMIEGESWMSGEEGGGEGGGEEGDGSRGQGDGGSDGGGGESEGGGGEGDGGRGEGGGGDGEGGEGEGGGGKGGGGDGEGGEDGEEGEVGGGEGKGGAGGGGLAATTMSCAEETNRKWSSRNGVGCLEWQTLYTAGVGSVTLSMPLDSLPP